MRCDQTQGPGYKFRANSRFSLSSSPPPTQAKNIKSTPPNSNATPMHDTYMPRTGSECGLQNLVFRFLLSLHLLTVPPSRLDTPQSTGSLVLTPPKPAGWSGTLGRCGPTVPVATVLTCPTCSSLPRLGLGLVCGCTTQHNQFEGFPGPVGYGRAPVAEPSSGHIQPPSRRICQ